MQNSNNNLHWNIYNTNALPVNPTQNFPRGGYQGSVKNSPYGNSCNKLSFEKLEEMERNDYVLEVQQEYKYYYPSFNFRNVMVRLEQKRFKELGRNFGKYTYYNRLKKEKN